jgi:hypothetical protein
MALARVTELGSRVATLEQLLEADEDDFLVLSELPVALHPDEPTIGPAFPGSVSNVWEGPIEAGVRDAIAGYRLAGYNEEEAAGLAREVLRLEVKRAGGWTP